MVVARVEGASSPMLGCPVMGVSGRKWPVVLAWVEGLSIMVFGGFCSGPNYLSFAPSARIYRQEMGRLFIAIGVSKNN